MPYTLRPPIPQYTTVMIVMRPILQMSRLVRLEQLEVWDVEDPLTALLVTHGSPAPAPEKERDDTVAGGGTATAAVAGGESRRQQQQQQLPYSGCAAGRLVRLALHGAASSGGPTAGQLTALRGLRELVVGQAGAAAVGAITAAVSRARRLEGARRVVPYHASCAQPVLGSSRTCVPAWPCSSCASYPPHVRPSPCTLSFVSSRIETKAKVPSTP